MKIYVCAGSSEINLAYKWMSGLREMGHTITHDWIATIREVGDANPRSATHRQRVRWSSQDLLGIEAADLIWLIMPAKTSFGAAFEAGYALGKGKSLIVSGDWKGSIFSAQAEARFNEHMHAFEWIRLYGTPGSHEDELAALEAG